MSDDLHNLLRDAEQSLPALRAAPRAELLRHVYARRRRRQVIRGGAALALLALLAFSPVWWMQIDREHLRATRHNDPTSAEEIDDRHVELAALTEDIARHTRTADYLVAAERRRERREAVAATESAQREDVLQEVQEQRQRAAKTLLMESDRLGAHPGGSQRAIEMYRRTIALFPDTPAAAVAERRLRER